MQHACPFHHALRGLLIGKKIGAYDGCFIALAEALDAPLITTDAKQATASGHQARVESY